MKENELGRFFATTFNNTVYEFIVYDNQRMTCPTLGIDSIYRLIIKPRFELFCDNKVYLSPAVHGVNDGLIKDYDINETLFNYLKQHNMIMYSVDMAYLYNLPSKLGYDQGIKEGSPFKWAKKKGPILVKQKRGIYN